jgi:hypothetical protein
LEIYLMGCLREIEDTRALRQYERISVVRCAVV